MTAGEAFKCYHEVLNDDNASPDQRIYAGIYLTKLCKDYSLNICTYEYATKSIKIAQESNRTEILYDLKYYDALSHYHSGDINNSRDKVLESKKLLEDIIENIDKLRLIYPYVIYIQLWKSEKWLGNKREALTAMEIAYKVAPTDKIAKSIGEKLYVNEREYADELAKKYVCLKPDRCDRDFCREALLLYKKLEGYKYYQLDSETYHSKYAKYIREGINAGVVCLSSKPSDK
ncbi:MAG TPA: hypothetical protein P5077_00215 [bacterium]|nr:hypothetical protein [bacterium]